MKVRPAAFVLVLALSAAGAAPAVATDDLPEAAHWLRDYVRIDTTNPPGGERAATAYLASILAAEGIESRTLVSPTGRASLYARLPGRDPGGGLLLLHHVDVVPAGPGWSVDPFAGEIRDGVLWGRGALDIKSLGISHLAAFVALHRLGSPPARDVVFLAAADEENGGGEGVAWLWRDHPALFDGIGVVLNEGGTNRAPRGEVVWWGVEIAQKRPLWLRVTATGRGGHGAGFNPHSAMHQLIRALDRLLARPPEFRVSDPVRTYMSAVAPFEPRLTRELFLDPDRVVHDGGIHGPMMPGVAKLFLDSVQVTVVEGSDRINVVPATAVAEIDVRLLPDTDADAFLAEVTETLGDAVSVEVLVRSPPAPASPVDHEAFRIFAAVLGREAPVVPAFISGFTDSRYFRQRGIPTYGFSPFVLGGELLRGIHGVDERIPLVELVRGVERMKHIVAAYAFSE